MNGYQLICSIGPGCFSAQCCLSTCFIGSELKPAITHNYIRTSFSSAMMTSASHASWGRESEQVVSKQ